MPPTLTCLLGFAGLLPLIAAVLVLLERNNELRYFALSMGYAYAALILSSWATSGGVLPRAPSRRRAGCGSLPCCHH